MSEIILSIICLALIISSGLREYFNQKERGRLLDRIMSKDIVEFKQLTDPVDTPEEEEEQTEFPIDSPEAMEGILNAR